MKPSQVKTLAGTSSGPAGKRKGQDRGDPSEIDRYRSIVFPNRIRESRKRAGFVKLLALSATIPEIPYVRLSKIERGEVFAKADELRRIAATLNVSPLHLLIDIDDSEFDIGNWAAELQDWEAVPPEDDRFAVNLAAAIRARRDNDSSLSIAEIEHKYGIAPVILSRLENAYKTFDRWNKHAVQAVCRLMDVADADALKDHVADAWAGGMLDPYLAVIANPSIREAKTRDRVAALRLSLGDGQTAPAATPQPRREMSMTPPAGPETSPVLAAIHAADTATVRLLPVFGSPLPDGLIERTPVSETVEAPRRAGPNAYGLRVCRPTLGPAMPGHAIVIVDPGRFPSVGGIAVLREAAGLLRLLIITADRQGRMIGYSVNPDREIPLDAIDPADIAAVISAILE